MTFLSLFVVSGICLLLSIWYVIYQLDILSLQNSSLIMCISGVVGFLLLKIGDISNQNRMTNLALFDMNLTNSELEQKIKYYKTNNSTYTSISGLPYYCSSKNGKLHTFKDCSTIRRMDIYKISIPVQLVDILNRANKFCEICYSPIELTTLYYAHNGMYLYRDRSEIKTPNPENIQSVSLTNTELQIMIGYGLVN